MGRVLLIIGAVVGGLVFAFGALGLILAFAQPDAHQSDEVVGSIFIMAVGAIVAAPCIFFAFRLGRRSAQLWQPGGALPTGSAGADLQAGYLAWFAWCQQTLGGDAVSLHAATMAAMAGAAAGNQTGAASAEAARQANRIATLGVVPLAPTQAKVRLLSRIGASTVGMLEPSERVVVSFWGMSRTRQAQLWALAFGAIGSIVAASQTGAIFVTVTDRRVIALRGGQFGGLANQVALIEPRSTVSVKFQRALLTLPRTFTLTGLDGKSVSIRVPKSWRPEAEMALAQLAPSPGQVSSAGIIR
jgi:hypothetical protein